jgi:hypothetical protein
MTEKLTVKQERFAQEMCKLGDQAKAYRIAYPGSQKWKDKTVWSAGSTMMANEKVSRRVKELQALAADAAVITRKQWLEEWRALAFTNLPGIINFERGTMTITEFSCLTDDQRRCIQSFKVKTENEMQWDETANRMVPVPVQYVEVKLYSKVDALNAIGKALGFDKPEDDDEDDGAAVFIGFQQVNQNITVIGSTGSSADASGISEDGIIIK